ncbi:hypothetical protein ACHAPU_002501 [Fusarium lateritium]
MEEQVLQTPLATHVTFREVGQSTHKKYAARYAHSIQSGPIPGSPDYPPDAKDVLDKYEQESKKYGSKGR